MGILEVIMLISVFANLMTGIAGIQTANEEETNDAEAEINTLTREKEGYEHLAEEYETEAAKYVIDDVADTTIEKNIVSLWSNFDTTKDQIQEQRDYIISQQKVGLAAGGISGKSGSALLIEEDSRRKAQEDIYAARKTTQNQEDIITTDAGEEYTKWMGKATAEWENAESVETEIQWWEDTYLTEDEDKKTSSGGKTSTGEHVGAR